ncbi:MAG: hypothetical protein EPO11_11215 [Gammaproteobacteria bacterium]|nr:MAG: hypothetical protein EPO11_11215 [Gammaproteobacteria bacterium]
MLSFILEKYLNLPIVMGLGAVFMIGMYLLFKKTPSPPPPMVNAIRKSKPLTITSQDFSAIAGDDVVATQLDLARAYIETGRKLLAKKILEHVVEQGTDVQQNEARTLLGLI